MKSFLILVLPVVLVSCTKKDSAVLSPTPSPLPSVTKEPEIVRGDLVRAVLTGDYDRVKKLLDRGADPNENVGEAPEPLTPLLAAVAINRLDLVRLLKTYKAAPGPLFKGYNAEEFEVYLEPRDGGRK